MGKPRTACYRFKWQVADWHSRRLSPERSREMAAHEKACASCQRAAQAELVRRQCFREAVPLPASPDLWPRLALHLEAGMPPSGRRRPALLPQRWAIAAAITLAVLAVCWSHLPDGLVTGKSRTTEQGKALTASATEFSISRQDAAWAQISRAVQHNTAAQEDPVVDDPTGPNMENIWTCLNADSK